MFIKKYNGIITGCGACLLVIFIGCTAAEKGVLPDHSRLAATYYGEDAQWYAENIPFFECSDKEVEAVYYYRWKLYKAHIRNVGPAEYVITEFINHVGWDRDPYCTINAASMHHIYEGRWLKDPAFMDGYINYLYRDGGNDRRYSESIADAAFARYLVNADTNFITGQLDSMPAVYDRWQDHYDSAKQLYYIPAMPDATEYTIASIDASGGKDGFEGGEAFRPTINSYMYGNALAIAHIAALKGDSAANNRYLQRAARLKATVERDLWNTALQHFTDRFKVNNQYVHYWDFIRGRELAGLIPWYFNLPADKPAFNAAWQHITDTAQLLGKYGFRTNEPSYEYYFKKYVFFEGKAGSQWNGPSWPYQTSQVLTGMANVLNDYHQADLTNSDYLNALRLFTRQHYLANGTINLVENYEPNKGGPIVHYYWSNHYNHSSYNNLVITGLCGIRPAAGDTLLINPLIDTTIRYFYLGDVLYHGRKLTVVYDRDGDTYKLGKGLTVFVDGKKSTVLKKGKKYQVTVGAPVMAASKKQPENFALNIRRKDYPVPTASVNTAADSLYQAIDGRCWYFTEITNRWTTAGSSAKTDWFMLDFGRPLTISTVKIYPFADNKTFSLPAGITIEYDNNGQWFPASVRQTIPAGTRANTVNEIITEGMTTARIRINFRHDRLPVAISEIECY